MDGPITTETLRGEKRREILRLARKHGCRNVRVFGSVATSENRPESDIDVLVDLEPGRTLFDLGGVGEDMKDFLQAEVDVHDSRCIHPYIRERVFSEAVPL